MRSRTSSRSTSVVALLTDFGLSDHFIAAMKGVLLSHDPTIRIIDISHHIEAGHVRSGAFMLWAVHKDLPVRAVCINVIDPGVGTERALVCGVVDGRTYLAPDNGLLDMLLATCDRARLFTVSNRKIRGMIRPKVSSTFHGRDIFAPLGARLATGTKPEEIGVKRTFARPPEWRVLGRGSAVPPAIMSVDRFGNIVTNIVVEDVDAMMKEIRAISIGKVMISVAVGTFAGAPVNTPCVIAGSSGLAEIIVRNGSAADILRVNDRSSIRIVWVEDEGTS